MHLFSYFIFIMITLCVCAFFVAMCIPTGVLQTVEVLHELKQHLFVSSKYDRTVPPAWPESHQPEVDFSCKHVKFSDFGTIKQNCLINGGKGNFKLRIT